MNPNVPEVDEDPSDLTLEGKTKVETMEEGARG